MCSFLKLEKLFRKSGMYANEKLAEKETQNCM